MFSFRQDFEEEFELLETEEGKPPIWGREQDSWAVTKADRAKPGPDTVAAQADVSPKKELSGKLQQDSDEFLKMFGKSNKDFILRPFKIGGKVRAAALMINGMADGELVNDYILRQAMQRDALEGCSGSVLEFFADNILAIGEIEKKSKLGEIAKEVLNGLTAILIEGEKQALIVETRGYATRSIDEPKSEKSVRGPHESFIENLRSNVTLLRRIIRTTDLMCEFRPVGGNNNTTCAVIYRRGLVNESLLKEMHRRLGKVKAEYLLSEGMVEQLTEKRKYSIISQCLSTERPDRTAALVMDGHIAILCDGSPFAIIVPVTFSTLMSSPEDYYMRRPFLALVRFVRAFGLFVTLLLPGIYVALLRFHSGLISTELINTILSSRQMVSFPVELELIFLLTVFHFIREAGLRTPGAVGQSLGVISGLVLGQAAVAANLVSSVMLILVATAGLGNYTIPDISMQFTASYLQLAFILAGTAFGLPGIGLLATVLIAYLCSVKSFGVPLFTPFAPKAYTSRRFLGRGVEAFHERSSDYTNMNRKGKR